jgi:hypothetical protein
VWSEAEDRSETPITHLVHDGHARMRAGAVQFPTGLQAERAGARTAPLLEHRVPYEGSVEAAIRVFPKGMPNNGLLRTLTKVSLLVQASAG